MTRWLCCLFSLVAVSGTLCAPAQNIPAPGVEPCDQASKHSIAVIQQQRQLLLQQKAGDDETEVAPALSQQIVAFKNSLASATDAIFHCISPKTSAIEMQNMMTQLLRANKSGGSSVTSAGANSDAGYGNDLKIIVSSPSDLSDLRLVQYSFGIPCGEDMLLLAYRPNPAFATATEALTGKQITTHFPDGFVRVLRWQAAPYDKISDAFGDIFLVTVLPDSSLENLRIAAVHGAPWCTSRFSRFGLEVLAPARDGDARVVWHTSRSFSRGDFEPRLKATADGFEFRVNVPSLDPDGYERTVLYRYKVAGDSVQRIGPIATTGRGFVEEWLTMPWDEAKVVTAPEEIATMVSFHERLAQLNKKSETYVGYEYGPVRACSVKGRYEVEMHASPGGSQYFAIQESPSGYILAGYGTTHDTRCNGVDVMKGH